jgi:hypothetical protein
MIEVNASELESGYYGRCQQQQYEIPVKRKDIKWRVNNSGDQINLKLEYVKRVDLIAAQYPLYLKIDVTKDMTKEKNLIRDIRGDIENELRSSEENRWEETDEYNEEESAEGY